MRASTTFAVALLAAVAPPALAQTPAPAPRAAAVPVYWTAKPTVGDVIDVYPRGAYRKGVVGDVDMVCTAAADGSLGGCVVGSERPAGQGFGEAALKLAGKYRVIAKQGGLAAVQGAKITVPVPFRVEFTPEPH